MRIRDRFTKTKRRSGFRDKAVAGLFACFKHQFRPAPADGILVGQGDGAFADHGDDPADAQFGDLFENLIHFLPSRRGDIEMNPRQRPGNGALF